MIKSAFNESGIKLAFPTVQIAGGSEAEIAAAAQQALAKQKSDQAAAAGKL
jgi:moderate conductance mechanosensitive channel